VEAPSGTVESGPGSRTRQFTVMRHSVEQALRVYDRRSTASKKHKGLELLASRQRQPNNTGESVSFSSLAIIEKSGPTVVLFQRIPHQAIREVEANGDRLLFLGKMARSLEANEPSTFCLTLSSTSSRATTALSWRASGIERVAEEQSSP
jgi:hypothetical protein